MNESEVGDWFAEYLSAFAAMGRGESQPGDVAAYYGAPFFFTSDDVVISLRTRDEVAALLQSQMDAMVAAKYHHTKTLTSDVAIVNQKTALHRAELSRRRADGTEINHMSVTYLITRESESFHISALLLHSP